MIRKRMKSEKRYRTKEVALILGISKKTLFRYEKSGVFPPAVRNVINGWREYVEEDVEKLKKIMGR